MGLYLVQTFPDEWQFSGSMGQQYKQIGNAVPVNLAYAIGCALIKLLTQIDHQSAYRQVSYSLF